MGRFYLKYGDTLPVLSVPLVNGDGTPHVASGVQNAYLHIHTDDGQELQRDMELVSSDPAVAEYAWQETDWDPNNPEGFLTVSVRHHMEYELVGTGSPTPRLHFPNGPMGQRVDVLEISPNIGQGGV